MYRTRPTRPASDLSATAVRHAVLVTGLLLAAPLGATAQQLASCDFGEPNPAAPPETADFQFLVGNWRIAVIPPDGAGGWRAPVGEAYWEGRYGLDGFAIVDYWYDGVPWETPTPPSRGVNTRMYDVQNEVWQMVWLHSTTPGVRRLQAKRRGDEMDMWQLNPDGTRLETRRTWFHDIGPDSWVRTDERSTDGGVTFQKALRLEATRLPCPVDMTSEE